MVDRLNTNTDPDSFSRIINESTEDFNTFELSDEGIDHERVDNNIGSVTTAMNGTSTRSHQTQHSDNKDLKHGNQYCHQGL